MTQAERLHDRFKLIEQSIAELHGKRIAFAAASAAWLMAVQYATEQSMKRLQRQAGQEGKTIHDWHSICNEDIAELDAEHEGMLRGFHKELCAHLEVDPEQALELSKSFEQVVRDICLQGG